MRSLVQLAIIFYWQCRCTDGGVHIHLSNQRSKGAQAELWLVRLTKEPLNDALPGTTSVYLHRFICICPFSPRTPNSNTVAHIYTQVVYIYWPNGMFPSWVRSIRESIADLKLAFDTLPTLHRPGKYLWYTQSRDWYYPFVFVDVSQTSDSVNGVILLREYINLKQCLQWSVGGWTWTIPLGRRVMHWQALHDCQ